MKDVQAAIDAYDIDVMMGLSHESSLYYAFKNAGVNREIVEHYFTQTGSAVVKSEKFGRAVAYLVAEWIKTEEIHEIKGGVLDHEVIEGNLNFEWTKTFPKHDRFLYEHAAHEVIYEMMRANAHLFMDGES